MEAKKEEIYQGVSDFYAQLIEKAREGRQDGCACVTGSATAHAERIGYSRSDLESVPRDAAGSSFGCGNPVAFAEVRPGETVLDLGSGAGIDCFLAAQRVGAAGRVIGLDMTREMVARARAAAVESGYPNVEFRLGRMEEMPVESRTVDWVISNCVINLSPDKEKVFAEAHRVLKPGGRLLVSDMVAENIPDSMREDISAWAGCIAGAVSEERYLEMIRAAGFSDVEVVDRVDYAPRTGSGPTAVASIRVRGVKRSQTQREEFEMKASQTGLDRETQLLVAAGAAVAAGCMPCLQTIVDMARAEGIEERKLKEAAMTGQYVKEQPNGMMKKFADELLGTHLQSRQPASGGECPLSGKPLEGSQPDEPVTQGDPGSCGCGCK